MKVAAGNIKTIAGEMLTTLDSVEIAGLASGKTKRKGAGKIVFVNDLILISGFLSVSSFPLFPAYRLLKMSHIISLHQEQTVSPQGNKNDFSNRIETSD
jgi:hypothetical protein